MSNLQQDGGRSAIGGRRRLGSHEPWSTVVGVAGDLTGNAKVYGDVRVDPMIALRTE